MQLNFFNTTELKPEPLALAIAQACNQNERVLKIFKRMDCKLTPLQVSEIYNNIYPECPVTSLRRSITVLTTKGLLVKCNEQRNEKYGHPNYYWRIKK